MNGVSKILLIGDYWHADFQGLIDNQHGATTLIAQCNLSAEHLTEQTYDLVVLAVSHRNQLSADWVQWVLDVAAPTPVVALLGSWCEGELRSGKPWPGVRRVYWHQWLGRFQRFMDNCQQQKMDPWQLPDTADHADAIDLLSSEMKRSTIGVVFVGISSLTESGYQMIADALGTLGYRTCWIERERWATGTVASLQAVCVDSDGWDRQTVGRVRWIREELEVDAAIVLLANFPRRTDQQAAESAGVEQVVSKPFQLTDLAIAINRSIDSHRQLDQPITP